MIDSYDFIKEGMKVNYNQLTEENPLKMSSLTRLEFINKDFRLKLAEKPPSARK